MKEVSFPRRIDNVLAVAKEHDLLVIAGWTIRIARATAIEYTKTFNFSPDSGFYEKDGNVILSHGPGKLTLMNEEARAIIELIKAAYGPF